MTPPILTLAAAWAAAEAQLDPEVEAATRLALRAAFYFGAGAAVMLTHEGVEAAALMSEVTEEADSRE